MSSYLWNDFIFLPSLVIPKPEAVPVNPTNWLLISLPEGSAMKPMVAVAKTYTLL